jgi:hypothetical protein
LHYIAETDELDKLRQTPTGTMEPEPVSAPARHDLQAGQYVHRTEIGRHQPRDVEVDDSVGLVVPTPLLVVRIRGLRQSSLLSAGLAALWE